MIVKISTDLYINPDEIKLLLPYQSNASKRFYAEAKNNEMLLDLTKGNAVKTLIFLKDNTVIATPFVMETITKKLA